MADLLDDALTFGNGLLVVQDYPDLRHRVRRAVTAGRLCGVLPGVYRRADVPASLRLQARALMAVDPTAVVTGSSAAWIHGWGVDEPPVCTALSRHRTRASGFALTEGRVAERLVVAVDGVRVTERALTALDLATDLGGSAIDEALRRGVPLKALWDVLERTPHRSGNVLRRRLLVDSRDRPWSEAERFAHRALRGAGVRGWVTNYPVDAGGRRALCDIALPSHRLALEIDGRAHHDGWERRALDCARDRRLARAGWLVLRFPARMVMEDPAGFVADVVAVLASRRGVARQARRMNGVERH